MVGSQLAVRYDPSDKAHVEIDQTGAVRQQTVASEAVRAKIAARLDQQAASDRSLQVGVNRVPISGSRDGAQAAKPDVADELTKLADLRDRGVLNDAEFETQKARILSSN